MLEREDPERLATLIAARCEGKVVFETFNQAKRVADRPRKKNPIVLLPYKCPDCGKFHLAPPKPKKKLKNGSRKKRTFGQ